MERPLCKCHGEPMHSNGSSYDRAGGKPRKRWVCATANKKRFLKNYDSLTGYQYNWLLLKRRRAVALRRRKLREEQLGSL